MNDGLNKKQRMWYIVKFAAADSQEGLLFTMKATQQRSLYIFLFLVSCCLLYDAAITCFDCSTYNFLEKKSLNWISLGEMNADTQTNHCLISFDFLISLQIQVSTPFTYSQLFALLPARNGVDHIYVFTKVFARRFHAMIFTRQANSIP